MTIDESGLHQQYDRDDDTCDIVDDEIQHVPVDQMCMFAGAISAGDGSIDSIEYLADDQPQETITNVVVDDEMQSNETCNRATGREYVDDHSDAFVGDEGNGHSDTLDVPA